MQQAPQYGEMTDPQVIDTLHRNDLGGQMAQQQQEQANSEG